MGTGEDLFYKCCAPSEELSTHSYFSKKFSLKFEILTMSISFLLEKTLYTSYILLDAST